MSEISDKKEALMLAELLLLASERGEAMYRAMDMQLKREREEFHIPANVAYSIYTEAMQEWEDFLFICRDRLTNELMEVTEM